MIALASPLDLSGPAVQAVALPTAGAAYPTGAAVEMAGFGRSSPTVQTSGPLSWMTATVDPQGECSSTGRGLTANNGIVLCASSPSGAVCNGDSGSGLVTTTGAPVLIGVVSAGAGGCDVGSHGTFTYTGAPEILQFVQGNDNPPTAPRETSATFLHVNWARRSSSGTRSRARRAAGSRRRPGSATRSSTSPTARCCRPAGRHM